MDKWLYSSVSGFVAGVFVRSFIDFGFAFPLFLGLLAFALFVYKGHPRLTRVPLVRGLLSLFLLATALGMLRFDLADRKEVRFAFDSQLGRQVFFQGLVVDEPDERETTTRLVVAPEQIEKTKILVITDREPKYSYGDVLQITGRLEKPENFTDEATLREVDYVSHLGKEGIYYELFRPRITRVAEGKGNWMVEKLFAFKHAFIKNISELIPQPHSALLAGLVVGAKQSLGKELLDAFRITGVIHIVVLSGYNITIIGSFIEWLLSALSRNKRLLFGSIAMILFAVMVGASATVVRATIMALLVILARSTGRLYAVTRALMLAGFLMLLHNPKILVYDTSFQLSFLATVGLIYFSPVVLSRVSFVTERWKLREIVVATISTQLFVLPFLLYKTGLFSAVSLPVNLLVLTIIPATMLFGFFAGIAGFVSTILAAPFAWVAYALLSYELLVIDWFARLPFASFTLSSFPLWLMLLWYAGYGLFLYRNHQKSRNNPALELGGVMLE
ncbi:MAG: ComEC/Rec2 family competence protein [bacterium]|nr:ComEC/Rec2 family competence protein [bacterium]